MTRGQNELYIPVVVALDSARYLKYDSELDRDFRYVMGETLKTIETVGLPEQKRLFYVVISSGPSITLLEELSKKGKDWVALIPFRNIHVNWPPEEQKKFVRLLRKNKKNSPVYIDEVPGFVELPVRWARSKEQKRRMKWHNTLNYIMSILAGRDIVEIQSELVGRKRILRSRISASPSSIHFLVSFNKQDKTVHASYNHNHYCATL